MRIFKTVRACFLGTSCQEAHIVHVPVRPGYEQNTKNIDVYAEAYVETEADDLRNVRDLSNCGHKVASYPRRYLKDTRYQWSIMFGERMVCTLDTSCMALTDQRGQIFRKHRQPYNELCDTFGPPLGDKASCYGNLLVVKTDPEGLVVDVLDRDLTYIEELVYA